MTKPNILPILVLISSIFLSACSLPFTGPKYAGLQVNADPKSAVYIDDKHAGETNYYDKKISATEHEIKISPLTGNATPWQTKVTLIPGLTTVISQTFGNSPQEASNYVIQLEKNQNSKAAELTIITTPENVIVRLDDQPKGFSPLTNIGVTADAHKVTLSAPGYRTENIEINTVEGYRLVLTAELGKSFALQPTVSNPSATESASVAPKLASQSAQLTPASPSPKPSSLPLKPSPTPKPSPVASTRIPPYVEILSTPTGWLRVRSEPNGLVDNEVGRVITGESFSFIQANDSGWYRIEYAPGKQGWIVSTYAKLVK